MPVQPVFPAECVFSFHSDHLQLKDKQSVNQEHLPVVLPGSHILKYPGYLAQFRLRLQRNSGTFLQGANE
ncbi:hypothetical protein D3C87_1979390 [compost metagenome]